MIEVFELILLAIAFYCIWQDGIAIRNLTKMCAVKVKETYQLQQQVAGFENRIKELVKCVHDKNEQFAQVQEHFAKIRDEMKSMKKRQNWLRDRFTQRLHVSVDGLPDKFYRDLKTAKREIKKVSNENSVII